MMKHEKTQIGFQFCLCSLTYAFKYITNTQLKILFHINLNLSSICISSKLSSFIYSPFWDLHLCQWWQMASPCHQRFQPGKKTVLLPRWTKLCHLLNYKSELGKGSSGYWIRDFFVIEHSIQIVPTDLDVRKGTKKILPS